MSDKTLFVNGEWIESSGSKRLDVINPATEEVIGDVALATEEDVDKAVEAANQAFPAWSNLSKEERMAYIDKLHAVIEKNQEEVTDTIVAELGSAKSYIEKVQTPMPLNEMSATLDEMKDFSFQEMKKTTKVIYEGYGVVACVTPWNFPINQIQRKVTPALLAGNTVVVKPASNTPLTAVLFAKFVEEAGLPKGVFNLVTGSGSDAGDYLTKHPDVHAISFTGSTEVGQSMMANASEHIKHVVLELGGKSALIYIKGGPLSLADAVQKAMDTVINNQGQTCAALTRLLVAEEDYDAAKEEILSYYDKKVKVGDPINPETTVGPMVSQEQKETVLEYIQAGLDEGAEILIGGEKVEGKGYYVQPTVFVNADNSMKIAREEIFGPVLTLLTYKTVEEAVEIANDSPYGLSGAVVGPQEEAERIALQLRTGNIYVNDGARNPYAPFGGFKQSGLGRENGIYGVKDYLQYKAIFL